MPSNLKLELKKPTRISRNNSIKHETSYYDELQFKDKLKKYMLDRTLARKSFNLSNLNILFCFIYIYVYIYIYNIFINN